MTESIIKEAPITATPAAIDHIRVLLAKNEKAVGLRLGTSTLGCNGLSYKVDYVEDSSTDDEMVEIDGVQIFIDRKEFLYLMGTNIDWEDSMFSTGFAFTNPNEAGRCGCGESFTV